MVEAGGETKGFEIPGYGDISQIGRGASSNVFKGFDAELNRWVAIKVLLTDDPDDPARRRFKREGEITANLGKHPHIVQVLGTGIAASGHPYVVMEFFDQGSIGDRLRSAGTFTVDETLDIGEKIADAVAAAHKAGVLHRDIKPQNILLSEYGPALADFGIARAATNLEWSQSLDQLTPMHSPPEVLMGGTSTSQSDIYSLGSTLYTMLAGRPPFAGTSGEAPLKYQVRVLQDPVPSIPRADLPSALTDTLHQALAKSPGDRQSSAAELRDALRSIRHGSPLPLSTERVASIQLDDTSPTHPLASLQHGQLDSVITEPELPTTNRSSIIESDGQLLLDTPTIYPSQLAPEAARSPEWTDRVDRSSTTPDSMMPLVSSLVNDQAILDEQTISRAGSTVRVENDEPSTGSSNRRHIFWFAAAGVLVSISLLGLVLTLTQPGPVRLQIKHVSTTTIAAVDQPTGLAAIPNGTSIGVRWQDPTNGELPFLVTTVDSANQKSSGHLVARGQSSYSAQGLSPNTNYCFEVQAIIGSSTLGEPSNICASTSS
jgi:serine/threonine protein kinase